MTKQELLNKYNGNAVKQAIVKSLVDPTDNNDNNPGSIPANGGAWVRWPYEYVALGMFIAGGYESANGDECWFVTDPNNAAQRIMFTYDELNDIRTVVQSVFANKIVFKSSPQGDNVRFDSLMNNPIAVKQSFIRKYNEAKDNVINDWTGSLPERFQALIASSGTGNTFTYNNVTYVFSPSEIAARNGLHNAINGVKDKLTQKLLTDDDSVAVTITAMANEIKDSLVKVSTEDDITSVLECLSNAVETVKNAINAIDVSQNVADKKSAIANLISGIDVSTDIESKTTAIKNGISGIDVSEKIASKQNEINKAISDIEVDIDNAVTEMHNAVIDTNWTDVIVTKFKTAFELYLSTEYTRWIRELIADLKDETEDYIQAANDAHNIESTLEGYINHFSDVIQQAVDLTDVYSDLRNLLSNFYAHVRTNSDLTESLTVTATQLNEANRQVKDNLQEIKQVLMQDNKTGQFKDLAISFSALLSAITSARSYNLNKEIAEKQKEASLF